MARSRAELHDLFNDLMGENPHVYFQPPPSVRMEYPAIVYNRDLINTEFAGNLPYKHEVRYQVTVIDRDPDSEIPAKVLALPQCTHDRWYAADGLNHDVFTIYF